MVPLPFFFLLLSSTLPNQCIYHLLNAHAAKKKKMIRALSIRTVQQALSSTAFAGFLFKSASYVCPGPCWWHDKNNNNNKKEIHRFSATRFRFRLLFPFRSSFFFSFSSLLLLASLVHHERAFQLRDGFVRAAADRVFRHVPAAVSPHFIPPRQRRALQEVPLQVQRSR